MKGLDTIISSVAKKEEEKGKVCLGDKVKNNEGRIHPKIEQLNQTNAKIVLEWEEEIILMKM